MKGAEIVDGSGRGPEARVPRAWMASPRVVALPDSAFRLWVALWSFADPSGGSAFPSIDTLSKITGKSRRATFRSLAILVESGLVRKSKPSGGWATTRYTLTAPCG